MLEPVEIGGTTVKLATLHNFDLVAREGSARRRLRAGEARRRRDSADHRPGAGEARSAATAARSAHADAVPGVRHAGASATRRRSRSTARTSRVPGASSRGSCTSRRAARWTFAGSRTRASSSSSTRGSSTTSADLYALTVEQLLVARALRREERARTWSRRSTDSKAQPLSRLLFGLGIRHVGETAAQLLARHFGTLDALMAARPRTTSSRCAASARPSRVAVVAYFADPIARR